MQVQRTFKKRVGVWGFVKGVMGGASQVAPLSPLTKERSKESMRCFANDQLDNKIFMHTAPCHCEALAEAINRMQG